MENDKVTIVIPIYNSEKCLCQCLDSVVNQTHHNLEVLCVNDGSTDSSSNILQSYAEKDERIKILSKSNGGLSSARNFALKHVTGDYVMYLDSDDWLDLKTIEVMLLEAKNENADSVMCSYVREYSKKSFKTSIFDSQKIVFESDTSVEEFHRRLFGPIGKELSKPERVDAPISACMQLFRKEIALSSSFVDTKIIGTFEDGLYQIDVYKKCHKIVFINEYFYHYRKTDSASLTSIFRPFLFTRWNTLYEMMFEKIRENCYDDNYESALYNRIALCFVSLCLNETNNKSSLFAKSKRLKEILKSDLYLKAMKRLSTKYMPLKWKIFFCLAKARMTFSLTIASSIAGGFKGNL